MELTPPVRRPLPVGRVRSHQVSAFRLTPFFLSAALLLHVLGLPRAGAQGMLFRASFLGRDYEVYRAPQRPAFFAPHALSNRRTVDGLFGPESFATAVGAVNGDILGLAAAFDPNTGITILRDGAKADEYSVAEDISDEGVIIGWDRPGPPVPAPGARRPPRAFIYSKESRLQYLDDLFPRVRELFEQRAEPDASGQPRDRVGTKGLSINVAREMILQGAIVPGLVGHTGLYRLSANGALTPFVADASGTKLNNDGQLPPPDPLPKDGLLFHNQFINDRGSVAGTVTSTNLANPLDGDASKVGIHVDGRILPDSARAVVTSFSNAGEVAADNGHVWDASGNHVDVRSILWSLGKDTVFKNQVAFTNGFSRGLINESGDIVWSEFFLRRVCPVVDLSAELVQGFEVGPGKLAVKMGATFKAKAIVRNPGTRAFEDVRVELYPPSPLFRQVGEPQPPIPTVLPPGAAIEAVFEWEPLQAGLYVGSFALHAQGECGSYENLLPPVPIEFQNSPLSVHFVVEPKPEGTNTIPLCSDFDVVALVTNLTSGPLKNVGPLSPPTNNAAGLLINLGPANPAGTVDLPAGGHAAFRWKMRAARLGVAPVATLFSGARDGIPFRVGPAANLEITIGRTDWIVNRNGDQTDADPSDICPDVDLGQPGMQTTLRAALDAANAVPGPQTIRFDLPAAAHNLIEPRVPLPAVTNEIQVLGTSQNGGWVEVSGARIPGAEDKPVWELRGRARLRGLAFTTYPNGPFLFLGAGRHVIAGCRFGIHADGTSAPAPRTAIRVAGDEAILGGTGTDDGNRFLGGSAAILALGLDPNQGPSGLVIEGNRFGNPDASGSAIKTGPANGVVLINTRNARLGGLAPAARNLFAGSSAAAVLLVGPSCTENRILGNWFGLTSNGGKLPLAEFNAYGIALVRGAHHNRIGGASAASRNIISGSDDAGVVLSLGAHDNSVEGNWIGLDANGSAEAGNEIGVWLLAGANNRIGGASADARNLISGNFRAGIFVGRPEGWKSKVEDENPGDEPSAGSVIEGNWIGLDASGSRAVPNGRSFRLEGFGVVIGRFAVDTLLGGTTTSRRNVISGNEGPGVFIDPPDDGRHALWGNFIGLSSDGASAVPNRGPGILVKGNPQLFLGGPAAGELNTVAHNAGPAVDLSGLKPGARSVALADNLLYANLPNRSIALASRRAANDPLDADSGPNGLQNWPLLLGAYNREGVTRLAVDLAGFKPNAQVRLDVFRSADGGGAPRLFVTNLVVGSNPRNRFLLLVPLQPVGGELTALATTTDGTSEFSPPIPVVAGTDTDGDGVPDELERTVPVARGGQVLHRGGATGPASGDLNGDGTPDELQANVASVRIPGSEHWITVAAAPGRVLTDLVGLRPTDVPPLPPGLRLSPGAIRFTLSGGDGSPQPLELRLATGSSLPVPVRAEGNGWVAATVAGIRTDGGSEVITLNLPASTPGSDWLLAAAIEDPALPPPAMTLLARREEVWNPPFGENAATLGAASAGSVSPIPRPLLPVRFAWPESPDGLRLETSADLDFWEEVAVWPIPGEPTFERAWPLDESVRFFRWRRD